MSWINYTSKMSIGDINEVDCLEFLLTRGDGWSSELHEILPEQTTRFDW